MNQEIEEIDTRQIDAKYQPIPLFEEWATWHVNRQRWNHYTSTINNLKSSSEDVLKRSLDVLKNAVAIETGAIENLYELNTGFTITAATQFAYLEAAINKADEKARPYIRSQLDAYDMVLDFSTQRVPIAEAWIRDLHREICKSQETYTAHTPVGDQKHPLPKGQYKTSPNHVITSDGQTHSYAPVDLTPDEMHKLCEQMHTKVFQKAHSVLQASYAHYCLVRIHPFADGNGRVARALGSVFTYRSDSMPLLILLENKKEYLNSLAAADSGQFQRFVDFIFERMINGFQVIEQSIRDAHVPPVEDVLQNLRSLYETRGGFSHLEVDNAGSQLFDLFLDELRDQIREHTDPLFKLEMNTDTERYPAAHDDTRLLISLTNRRAVILARSASPTIVQIVHAFGVEVPRDCGPDDPFFITHIAPEQPSMDSFKAFIRELRPQPSTLFRIRLKMWVGTVLSFFINEISTQVKMELWDKGYTSSD